MKPLDVVVLSEGGVEQASAAHRVYAPAVRLEEEGTTITIVAGRLRRLGPSRIWWVGPRSLWKVWVASKRADVVVIHRTSHLGVALLCWMVTRLRRLPVVFDFDDAIHVKRWVAGPHPLYAGLRLILRMSAVAWCGSHALRDFAAQFTSAQLVPTPAARAFERFTPRGTNPPTIVWMGNGPVHLENLRILLEPLERLNRVSRFRLRILSSLGNQDVERLFDSLSSEVDVDFGWTTWQEVDTVARAMAQCDVGVMPLRDTPWNRGKCAMKAIESMALGLPVVCSAVGENRVVAGDDEYALLARDPREWYRALRALLRCPPLRRTLGTRGRTRVRTDYAEDVVLSQIRRSLRDLVGSSRGRN